MIPLHIEPNDGRSRAKYLEDLAEEHYHSVINSGVNAKVSSIRAVEQWIRQYMPKYDFHTIVTADIDVLRSIYCDFKKLNNSVVKVSRTVKGESKDDWVDELRWIKNRYGNVNKVDFTKHFNLTVCPYCNRAYINMVKKKDGKAAVVSDLDHFIPQGDCPLLAVSFFNLVPVCKACNQIKHENPMGLSVHEIKKHDAGLRFSYTPLSTAYLSDANALRVELKGSEDPIASKNMKENIKALELETLYQIHSDYVQELLIKQQLYPQERIEQMLAEFPELFHSKEEVKRVLFGNYTEDDELHKRPLAKLTADILRELESN